MRQTTLALLIIVTLLSGCQPMRRGIPVYQPPAWGYADLRALDPAGDGLTSQDIIALFTRTIHGEVQIRLDVLDVSTTQDSDLYIALDTESGGINTLPVNAKADIAWDVLMTIPAGGGISVVDATGQPISSPKLHVFRDSYLDTVTVSFDPKILPSTRLPFTIQVFTAFPGASAIIDSLNPVRSDATPPAPARVLIAFSNSFPAVTPAQALRRWDGAHSGPDRSRHGLRHLLAAVAETHIPAALLDLKDPAALSALDYIGALPQISDLAARGLLILPETGSTLNLSDFEVTLPNDVQATAEGLSLESKRLLIQSVKTPSKALLLGGDLTRMAWGEPQAALRTLTYIAAHPWIQPLSADEVMAEYLSNPPLHAASSTLYIQIQEALTHSPPNVIAESARQMYESLAVPSSSQLTELRVGYLGQVGHLLAAARWAESPAPRADCAEDVDWDGQAECILASEDFFTILETDGGRLTVAVALTFDGIHQIIGPSYQFAVGLSDPSEWEPGRGVAGDPSAIPGAFSDNLHSWDVYLPMIAPGQITFTLPDESLQKTFTLTTNGLRADYRSAVPLLARIPLAIDPWVRFTPGWGDRYRSESIPGGWSWGLDAGPQAIIRADGELTSEAFTDSRAAILSPEDPNFDYGAGHFLPFPLALAEVYGQEFWVEIEAGP